MKVHLPQIMYDWSIKALSHLLASFTSALTQVSKQISMLVMLPYLGPGGGTTIITVILSSIKFDHTPFNSC